MRWPRIRSRHSSLRSTITHGLSDFSSRSRLTWPCARWGSPGIPLRRRSLPASLPHERFTMKAPTLPPFDYQPNLYSGPSAEEVMALRRQYLNPAIFHYYKQPLMIVEGKGQYVFDEKGRRYLDGFAGIV